jgi:hypothetical protein
MGDDLADLVLDRPEGFHDLAIWPTIELIDEETSDTRIHNMRQHLLTILSIDQKTRHRKESRPTVIGRV